MNSDIVATSFGRRGVSLGLIANQFASRKIDHSKSIDKWKLFRAICEAKPSLGVSDRSLAVLNALISFYPKAELSEENGLVVFPSNQQLSLRAHGMTEQTLRRHLAALVDAGLILRKDSPNGKRYARKDRTGGISDAYGFSLAPLITRSNEINDLAEKVIEDRLHLQRLREKISLCRRDVIKFREIALTEGIDGPWDLYQQRYLTITSSLDRKSKAPHLALVLDDMTNLHNDMAKRLEKHIEKQNLSANAYQNERHIQSSESESLFEKREMDNEPKTAEVQTVVEVAAKEDLKRKPAISGARSHETENFNLQTVLNACPDISLYGPNGAVRDWNDLKQAARVVRSMLSISQSAYDEAEKAMGTHRVNTIIACILEKAQVINSAGGYLRSLTDRANEKQFSIQPMLNALMRARLTDQRSSESRT
ncbi:plasmid replication protein RepC [Agrobacterium sp. rho-8.1]|nr:plasmid replication protein RepC [Agrobacterium sp. rho-8.1]